MSDGVTVRQRLFLQRIGSAHSFAGFYAPPTATDNPGVSADQRSVPNRSPPTFRPTACPRKLLPPLRKTGIRIERTCRSAPATLTFFIVRRRSGLPSYSVLPNDRSLFTTVQYRPAGHIRTRRDIMPRQNTPNDRITTKRNLKRIFQNMPKRHTDCFSLYLIQIYLNYHIYFIYFGIHKKKKRGAYRNKQPIKSPTPHTFIKLF